MCSTTRERKVSKRNRKPRTSGYDSTHGGQGLAELPDWAKTEVPQAQGTDWLTLLGFQLSDEITIFPIGITGQSLGGELVDIALNPDGSGPILVTIRNAPGRPNVSIPWSSIMMITKAEGPRVDVPQPAETTLADLVEFAETQGIDIPDEVRVQALAEGQTIEDLDSDFVGLVDLI